MPFFLLLLILCLGCHKSPPPQNCLRTCFAKDPVTLDPKKSGDFISSSLICLLFEGLTRCKGGSEIELALAQKIEVSPDGKSYFFFLKDSLWSDGTPVTAHDFEHSWKTLLDPQFPSLCAYLLYPIKNAKNYVEGTALASEIGIYALDQKTLKVDLEEPTPYFLSLTAFPLYLPTPSHTLDLVSNGPFRLKKMVPNSEILIEKNPLFWNAEKIRLDQIHITILPDEKTAVQLFDLGKLDLVGGPLLPLCIEDLSHPLLRVIPIAGSTLCTLNTKTAPFQDKKVRKLLAKSLQEGFEIAQVVEAFGHTFAKHLLPPSLRKAPEKPDHAAESSDGKDLASIENLPPITLYYKPGDLDKTIAQTLQHIWKKNFDISLEIQQVEPKCLLQKLHTKNYQIALTSWIAQFDDPISILERFSSASHPKNYPDWEDAHYQALLKKSAQLLDPKDRFSILSEAEKQLEEEHILIPLYHWNSPLLVHPRVKNLAITHSGGILLERCSLE